MGWIIFFAIITLIWIALMQPVWINLIISDGKIEAALRYLGVRMQITPGKPRAPKPIQPQITKKSNLTLQESLDLIPDLLHAVRRSLGYLIRKFEWKHILVDVQLGFEDPMTTGLVYGALSSGLYLIPQQERVQIDVTPDFEVSKSRVNGEIEGGIRPSSMINAGLILLWHLPKRRLIRLLRAGQV